MSALSTVWTIITDVSRIDDDTTRLTLTDIGVALDGTKFSITGVGSSEGDLYENLQFTATRVTDNTVDIDWSEFGYTAPADDWTTSGMVKLYEVPIACEGSMRVSFNSQAASLTSTGDSGETGKDNLLNSNRGSVHTLSSGDQSIVATMETVSLVDSITLLDISCSIDAKIRLRGEGLVSPIDVTYPAISARYKTSERPKLGYGRINSGGHNLDDLVSVFVAYTPPMFPSTVTIDIIGSTEAIEISELIICSYYTPEAAKNINFNSQLSSKIVGDLVQRGVTKQLDYKGLDFDVSFVLDFMDAYDRTYIDLMKKSKGTVLFDFYPLEYSMRWEYMVAGFLTATVPVTAAVNGGQTEIQIATTKLHAGI